MTNLVYHQDDFGIRAEWHFFATSHGKSACDGIGGTVKREAARASLRATTTGHILTPQQLLNFHWPIREDFCWVSTQHILTRIQPPKICKTGRVCQPTGGYR